MSDLKDPAIKLFGRNIPLQEWAATDADVDAEMGSKPPCPLDLTVEAEEVACKETEEEENNSMKLDPPKELQHMEANSSFAIVDKSDGKTQTSTADDKAAADSKDEHVKTVGGESGQEKVLKKPDKILPCPRCNSMDTKFCYYNNYNINQPRHFCKKCQRYWTAGGTMRNVPVGAGRRKSKSCSSHYRHIMMAPDGLIGCQGEVSNSVKNGVVAGLPSVPKQPANGTETVLKFGPEVPLCKSMASVLNVDEQKENCIDNGLPENAVLSDQNGGGGYCNGVAPVHQYYLGAPFMHPWSLGWNSLAAIVPGKSMSDPACASENCSTSSAIPWMHLTVMPAASCFPAPIFPFPLVPPSLWGCLSSWPTATWNERWIGSNGGSGSPTLGKHLRDSNLLKEEKKEKSLWVPKTLRIDDPDEAAKSSIWATLGIKPGERGMFRPLQSRTEGDERTSDAARLRQANPAALSRSRSFQESS